MKTKVINLDAMLNGFTCNEIGEEIPCPSIRDQMMVIFHDNPTYDFVDLVYHPSKTVNMQYASLIVHTK